MKQTLNLKGDLKMEMSITQLLAQENVEVETLWFDWFCKDSALERKGKSLLSKVKAISKSDKFDNNKCYVFFKNCCPCFGRLYDQFKICDIESGDVLYCVTPKSGHYCDKGLGEVWGVENNFQEPLVVGNWKELKQWFLA